MKTVNQLTLLTYVEVREVHKSGCEVAKLRIQGLYFLVQSVTQYKISVSDHENNLKCGPKLGPKSAHTRRPMTSQIMKLKSGSASCKSGPLRLLLNADAAAAPPAHRCLLAPMLSCESGVEMEGGQRLRCIARCVRPILRSRSPCQTPRALVAKASVSSAAAAGPTSKRLNRPSEMQRRCPLQS